MAFAHAGLDVPDDQIARQAEVMNGVVVMAVVLMTLPNGPGTLFPIAIVIGGVLITVGSVVGAMAAWLVTRTPLARSATK